MCRSQTSVKRILLPFRLKKHSHLPTRICPIHRERLLASTTDTRTTTSTSSVNTVHQTMQRLGTEGTLHIIAHPAVQHIRYTLFVCLDEKDQSLSFANNASLLQRKTWCSQDSPEWRATRGAMTWTHIDTHQHQKKRHRTAPHRTEQSRKRLSTKKHDKTSTHGNPALASLLIS